MKKKSESIKPSYLPKYVEDEMTKKREYDKATAIKIDHLKSQHKWRGYGKEEKIKLKEIQNGLICLIYEELRAMNWHLDRIANAKTDRVEALGEIILEALEKMQDGDKAKDK